VAESDLALHRYWVSLASKELEMIWLSITVRMRMGYSQLENFMEIYREHELIVKAIRQRDLKSAQFFIFKNIA
jgi:DNA-binding GntR family transcriptional regulator